MGGGVIGMHRPDAYGGRPLIIDWGRLGNIQYAYPVGSAVVRRDPSLYLDLG
jgi:hypothetical protein